MLKKGTIRNMGSFYINTPEYSGDISRAIRTFFGKKNWNSYKDIAFEPFEEGFFNEWLTYDFKFSDGKGMLEKYYYENPENIPEYRRKIYKDLMENYFGLFEILEVRPFNGLKLRRLHDKKEFDVYEMSATTQVEKGDMFFTRVANVGDRYEMAGCDSLLFQLSDLSEPERLVQIKAFSKYGELTPIDAVKILKSYS